MATSPIDPHALISMFETATAKQGEQVRKAVGDATLAALQGRELSLKNIRSTLKSVTEAANAGVAKNMGAGVDAEAMLEKAVAGMDDALLKAVEANRLALARLVDQGADLREKHLKKALADMDKFEDSLMGAVRKMAEGADSQFGAAWGQVLEKMQAGGTASGLQATATTQQLLDQMQSAMRETRSASLRAAQVMAESYTAMVSGVLIGMSEALQQGKAPAKPKK